MHSNTDAPMKHANLEFSLFVDPPPAKLNLNSCAAPLSPNTMLGGVGKIETQGLPQLCTWG